MTPQQAVERIVRQVAEQIVLAVDKAFESNEKLRLGKDLDPEYRRRAIREIQIPYLLDLITTTRREQAERDVQLIEKYPNRVLFSSQENLVCDDLATAIRRANQQRFLTWRT